MTNLRRKHQIDGLLALALLGLFAVCILAVLLSGARTYRRLAARDDAAYDRRTAVQYVATKVRQADRIGSVAVEEFGGVQALLLREELEGELYETRIYCHDGYLRELFTVADSGLLPEDGEKILPAQAFSVALETPGDRLRVALEVADGDCRELVLHLRSGEGAVS